MQSKVHPTYKTKYRVANWAAYNQALVRCGDVTVWVSSEAIAAWTPRRSGRRGGQRRYSDLAIETALTLRLLYHLPLRQAEGFLHVLFGMMRLDLSAPDYTTLSRRSQPLRRRLRPVSRPARASISCSTARVCPSSEAGEWAAAKHGGRGQTWLAEAPPWRRSVRRDPRPHADRGDGGGCDHRPRSARRGRWRRCCTNRNWPARGQSTRSSPADAIRHWSTEGGHPIENLTANDGLTPLPSWTPGAKAIADDGLGSEERILHPALTMVP